MDAGPCSFIGDVLADRNSVQTESRYDQLAI
jgi:hypothetical protein